MAFATASLHPRLVSLNFVFKFWVAKWDEGFGKKLEATEKVYDALNKAGIGIAFPTQTLYLKK